MRSSVGRNENKSSTSASVSFACSSSVLRNEIESEAHTDISWSSGEAMLHTAP